MDTIPFGQQVADLRRQKGFSQDGLAYLCKIDVRTVQRIETGRVEPRPSTLKMISEILGPMPVSELWTTAGITFMASGRRCCDGRPHSGAGKEKPS